MNWISEIFVPEIMKFPGARISVTDVYQHRKLRYFSFLVINYLEKKGNFLICQNSAELDHYKIRLLGIAVLIFNKVFPLALNVEKLPEI